MAKEKDSYSRYAYYREYIEKIGRMPLNSGVRIKDLGLTPGAIQMAYKEMKRLSFAGNIGDYLAWVSAVFLLTLWRERKSLNNPPLSHGDHSSNVMRDILNERPGDGVVLLRAVSLIRVVDLWALTIETMAESTPLFHVLTELGVVRDHLLALHGDKQTASSAFEVLLKAGYEQLTRHYMQNQGLALSATTSFPATSTNQQPQTESTTTPPPQSRRRAASAQRRKIVSQNIAPSGASEATRSGASSKGRRTTRP